MSENTNLVEYYKDLLIMQYADKVKANETVESLAKALMIFDVASQVRDGYDIETAVGVQQDVLGKYLGAPRVITGTTFTRNYFGFMEYGDTAPFDFFPLLKYGEEAPDAQFRNYNESTQSLFALNDEEYRIIQKLAIVRNNSNASVKVIDDILFQLFGAECYFIDRMNMTVVSYMVGDKWSRLFSIAKSSGLLPNPTGVGTGLIVVPDINNIFSFSLYSGEAPSFAVGFILYSDSIYFFPIEGDSRLWVSLASDPSGNIWAIENGGDIYKCNAGTKIFTALGSGLLGRNIHSDINGNIWVTTGDGVYKCDFDTTVFNIIPGTEGVIFEPIKSDKFGNVWVGAYEGKIYKIETGTETLIETVSLDKIWTDIVADVDGNIWASVYGEDIYKCNEGETTFTAIGGTSRLWRTLASDSFGNIWAGVYGGSIYKCDFGTTSFVSLGTDANNWRSIEVDIDDNIWAAAYVGDIYKCESGETTFVKIDSPDRYWSDITSDPDGNVWASEDSGDIYKHTRPDTTGCMAKYS